MLSFALGLGLFLAAPPDPQTGVAPYAPCRPGLLVEYEVHRKESTQRFVDLVRGPGKEPNTCVIDRVRKTESGKSSKEPWLRERLRDRVTYAGTVEMPLAFRPPVLKAPLEAGHRWRFDRTEYRITRAGFVCSTPAGRFESCVEVRETSIDGKGAHAVSIYAPNVGLVSWQQGSTRMEAIRVLEQERTGR